MLLLSPAPLYFDPSAVAHALFLAACLALQTQKISLFLLGRLIPICKLVVFTLSPVLLFIWSTSLDLWGQISSSLLRVSGNTSHLLYFVEDLISRAWGLVISSKQLVKSLTCNDLDASPLDLSPDPLHVEHSPSLAPPVEESQLISKPAPGPQTPRTQRIPWLLAGIVLMGFNSYFCQLSPTFYL
ncbi:hypothetical protein DSO57_1016904 [Entomophthora muscae]|uniref:Uncharacterized protein n=1 Tax=Entomophthora muscae TaxID=34485 RepID=A0ACC2T4P8_9FUNG|nr:hypothetical protein DSO57_1016904 [Entomophthora muscae]